MNCGNEPGPATGIVEVVDDVARCSREVVDVDVDLVQAQAARVGDGPRVAALVVALVLGELAGEAVHRRRGVGAASAATMLESRPPLR